MTVKNLHKFLSKEIADGNSFNPILLSIWGEDGPESIEVKGVYHCSDAVVIEPKEKVTSMNQFVNTVKEFFGDLQEKLNKWLKH